MTLDEAYAQCARRARRGRPDFPAGSFLLPRERRRDVHAILAFARGAADLADEGVTPADASQRLKLLDEWGGKLGLCLKGEAGEAIFVALRHTIGARGLSGQLFLDLIAGFREEVTKARYASFEELRAHCGLRANPIGRLVLQVFGHRDEERAVLSDRIFTALQLANFWNGVRADLGRGKIYLPADERESFGVTEEALGGRHFDEGFLRLMQYQVRRAREILDSGRRLLTLLEGRVRAEFRMLRFWGMDILGRIEAAGFDSPRRRPNPRGLCAVRLMARAAFGGR